MKVLTIFGTRPEAVKLAPVIQQLEQAPGVESLVCVTAQHREMLDQVLRIFEIIPEIDLDLMREDQSLAELSAAVFSGLDMVFREIRPDWVLIQGDTTTVMAAGLLAYFHRIRVGHVEAGLRTGDSRRRLIAGLRGWWPICISLPQNGPGRTCCAKAYPRRRSG